MTSLDETERATSCFTALSTSFSPSSSPPPPPPPSLINCERMAWKNATSSRILRACSFGTDNANASVNSLTLARTRTLPSSSPSTNSTAADRHARRSVADPFRNGVQSKPWKMLFTTSYFSSIKVTATLWS